MTTASTPAALERFRYYVDAYDHRGWSLVAYEETPPRAMLLRLTRPRAWPFRLGGVARLTRLTATCREVRLDAAGEVVDTVCACGAHG